jgi:hypothetical protein
MLPTFEEAIAAEEERLREATPQFLHEPAAYSYEHDHHSYLARGRYAEQLELFLERFDSEQLLVMPAESMFRTPQAAFDRVQHFLGLPLQPVTLAPRNQREGYPPIAPATRDRLKEYYRPHNERLRALLGEDYGWD